MRHFRCFAQILLTSAITFAPCSCKGVPNPTTGGGGGDGGGGNGGGNGGGGGAPIATPAPSFLGDWNGIYKNKDTGAELKQTEAHANFQASDNYTGTFRIDLNRLSNVYAMGTYIVFNQTSLHLTISQSNISTVGDAGTLVEMNYSVTGNSIELFNDKVDLRLTHANSPQSGPQSQPNGAGGQNAGQDVVYGHWKCVDQHRNQWQVNLNSGSVFTVEIFDANGERGGLWLQGASTITRAPGKPDITLNVQQADVDKYRGMTLSGTLQGNGQLNLQRGSGGETMPCDRA